MFRRRGEPGGEEEERRRERRGGPGERRESKQSLKPIKARFITMSNVFIFCVYSIYYIF